MSVASRIQVAVVGAVLAASLTACGSGSGFADQSASAIMKQAKKDTTSLHSVRLTGSITQSGGKLAIDLAADDRGDCSGTMGVSGGKADVLSVDGSSYLRGDEAFWRASAGDAADQVIGLLAGKWAKLPSGQDDFSQLCDVDKLLAGDGTTKKYTKGKVGSVGGKEAVEILVTKGSETAHAWIATEGRHYLLRLDKSGGTEPGSFRLSDFDEPVDAKAPAEGEYVDLGKLGG